MNVEFDPYDLDDLKDHPVFLTFKKSIDVDSDESDGGEIDYIRKAT